MLEFCSLIMLVRKLRKESASLLARPTAVFGVAFLPDFLGRRHRKLVASSCAATGHSATQREAQHAAVAASSAKVVSTLGAARTSCSSSRTQLWLHTQTIRLRLLAPTIEHRRCTFDPWRCASELQHSAPLKGADIVPSALGVRG